MDTKLTRKGLERAVVGALRSAINDHGPITADKITSATKRILGNLRNAGLEIPAPEAESEPAMSQQTFPK